uniref:Ankyrin-1 n=1 Tax=Ascaris suum TaxID=6253 RepID=F1KQ68_ASCSU
MTDLGGEGAGSPNPQPAADNGQHSNKGESSASFLRAARAGNLERVLELLRSGTDINTCNANGLNALHLASKEGHHEVVRELLKRKALVDAATKKGNTALHIASLAGQEVIVTILVENGANVNVQSLNGFTPLYMAAQENHESVVRYLLAHGANQALATEDGFTPLAVALQQGHDRVVALLLENDTRGKVRLPALHIAAKKDDTKAATLLLQNEHNADVTSKSGFTPLHIAAHYGNENVAQLLLEKGANVNYQARHNISPLHVATKWGRANMVSLLLAHGAVIDCRTRDLLTPLHCAARSGHDQVVDLLLEKGAPINAKTKNGLAPLHMAAQGDHVDTARILLYHRAPVDDVTVDYLTPLHVAAHCGHVRVAKLLLDRNADPNARALNGFTPLHIACKKNRIKVVELLLKYHAAIEATTESGLSPLHVAAFMGAINIVIYLLQQGANADVATVRGETPLHLAARANQTDIVRVLVRDGAKVDAAARELQTPLHIASRLGNTDIVVLLLQAGASPNAATRDQYTPLHIAAKEGQEEVAAILLDRGADKTLLTKKGFTPLHLAAKYGNLQVAKLLLERGTPVDIEGKNQVTPLHVAAHYNNDKVALLLLENGASAHAAAKNGYTPLHIAAKKNQMDIATTLLHYKADTNAESKAGFSPLHLAAQEGHREMCALLIENGAKVGATAKNGLTPMHLCAQEDRVNVAEELVKEHAAIDPQTKAGYTPLHVACHFGQMNMVRFLIEHGAPVSATTRASYTPLHQAAQQGHNNVVRYLLEHGASPNVHTATGQTPLSIAERLGYVSVVEALKTVTETTVITETTTITEERYKPQNPEAMNETMFSDSEDEATAAALDEDPSHLRALTHSPLRLSTSDDHDLSFFPNHTSSPYPSPAGEFKLAPSREDNQVTANAHVRDFSESLTQGLHDSTGVHLIHTAEPLLSRSPEMDTADGDLDALIRKAQHEPVATAMADSTLDATIPDNVALTHTTVQPSKLLHKTFLISFMVDARGGAMRGCRHSGVRIIIPPRKASQPMRITCRYLRRDKLAHPPPLSEGEALASRVLEMAPHGAKFLGPVILEVPHFASLRGREREIVILRSDDGQHWKEHQLEATEDAVQEVLNESFDAEELSQLDDLHTTRITRILTNDFPMYFAVVTRVRQEVHCVGPEGGVILSSVVPRVQAIFPDGSLTKTIKVSVQAQPVPHEIVTRLHGNRVAVSPIVTVEPRRRKFHKPITLCIPLPQSAHKGMLTQYSGQPGQEPPTLRLLCSITGGSAPAQWEDITGTTQLTFTGEDVSFTTTVSARFWLMDCQTPRDAARMAQEVYNEAIAVPYMAKFVIFARRTFPTEGQLRVFCMTDDREDKTLEKQEHFIEIAKSKDVEVLSGRHQFLEFAGNIMPVTKSGDQLSLYFLPFQENRLAFLIRVRSQEDEEAAAGGRIAFMKEPKARADSLPPQQPLCTLAITLPDYTGQGTPLSALSTEAPSIAAKYSQSLRETSDPPGLPISHVSRLIGADWHRLARALEVPDTDIRHVRQQMVGRESITILRIWIYLKKEYATPDALRTALRRIGREDVLREMGKDEKAIDMDASSASHASLPTTTASTSTGPVTAATASVTRAYVQAEEPFTEDVSVSHSTAAPSYQTTPEVQLARASTADAYVAEPLSQAIVQEEDEEVPVSEIRTVVRTERHVHDSENGPIVEERTITTTYEDDVAINEEVVDRIVPLNAEEQEKWDRMVREAQDALERQEPLQSDDGTHREVYQEEHEREDGTIVKTTTVKTSHITREEPQWSDHYEKQEPPKTHTDVSSHVSEAVEKGRDAEDAKGRVLENEGSATAPPSAHPDTAKPVTDQKHESMAEGFTSEDGSTVVSKKMTRVVTTTRTTLPGDTNEQNAGDLIRLKVNEQVYSGSVDPSDQHIHLVPITKVDQPSQPQ